MTERWPFALLALVACSAACSLQKGGTGEDISFGGDTGIEDSSPSIDEGVDSVQEDTVLPDSTSADTSEDGAADSSLDASEAEAETGGDLAVTCTEIPNGTVVDLTKEGTAGWAHYGLVDPTSYDHKVSPDVISDVTVVGSARMRHQYFDTSVTWSDGTPTAITTPVKTGLYLAVAESKMVFNVIGDGSARTLRFYVRPFAGIDGSVTLALGAATQETPLPKSSLTKTYACGVTLAWSSSLQVTLTKHGSVGGVALGLLGVTLE
ncbi:MAG: hypothetical protein ACXVEE_42670 [Polyangiales bacterium]